MLPIKMKNNSAWSLSDSSGDLILIIRVSIALSIALSDPELEPLSLYVPLYSAIYCLAFLSKH